MMEKRIYDLNAWMVIGLVVGVVTVVLLSFGSIVGVWGPVGFMWALAVAGYTGIYLVICLIVIPVIEALLRHWLQKVIQEVLDK